MPPGLIDRPGSDQGFCSVWWICGSVLPIGEVIAGDQMSADLGRRDTKLGISNDISGSAGWRTNGDIGRSGAPRPMKMGTTLSLSPYDAAARDALQLASLRCSAIWNVLQHMKNRAAYAIRYHEAYQVGIMTTLMRLQGARFVSIVEPPR